MARFRQVKALVIGASGLVGGALIRQLGAGSVGTFNTRPRAGLEQLDASNASAVRSMLREVSPDVVFFPAANPNVEWCEAHPSEAREANIRPLRSTIEATSEIPVVAFSSDYVFDGQAGPYAEDAAVAPLSVYGRIKVELEERVADAKGIVIRSTGIFGREAPPAKNSVMRIIESLSRGDRVDLPCDQVANPTYVEDLAAASIRISEARERGLWHVGGGDLLPRDELGRAVARAFGLREDLIRGVATADLGQHARRPLLGGLTCDRYRIRFGVAPGRAIAAALVDLRTQLRGAG